FVSEFQSTGALISLLAVGLAEAFFWSVIRSRIHAIVDTVDEPARDLDLLSQILAELERCDFRSPRLASLKANVQGQSGRAAHSSTASDAINRLRRWMELLD